MDRLKQKIREEAVIISEQVLSLDSVLNHLIDPVLIMDIGQELAGRFAQSNITKVVTVESSGIAVGFATAFHLKVPMVFARKKKTREMSEDYLIERVPSFTKGIVTDLALSRHVLNPEDRVLVIDDILANGVALQALQRMIVQTGATVAGLGVVIEKTFQNGSIAFRQSDLHVESVVRIRSLANETIEMD
jgi:xanthine phosphoribosyltransferase